MADAKKMTVLQINDVHGYLDEHYEMFFEGNGTEFKRAGGYARMFQYVENARQEAGGDVILLDGGDTFHGTRPVVDTKGEILLPIVNKMKFDGMTAHWDFAYGPDYLELLSEDKLNYPVLAINCFDSDTDELAFQPYIMKEVNGVKAGIIGIAATIVDKVMPKGFSQGVYFTDGKDELPKYIQEVKEKGADIVIVMSHLGLPQDIELADETDGIDILLSAHTHNRMYEPAVINDTIIIQSGCHGSFVGRLDITVQDGKVTDFEHVLAVMDESVEEDAGMKQLIEEQLSPYKEQLNEVIGETETELHRYEILECTMDNLLLQSLLHCTDADIAFSNGWRYGAPIPKGPITMNDIWNIIPVNPPVSTVKLTGDEIWELMEKSLEVTFSREPFHQMGGYVKRALGLKLYAKLENPSGQRMQDLFIGEERVDKEKVYDVAFVTVQGVPPSYGKDRKDLNIRAVEALRQYIEKEGTVEAPLRGTITLI